MFQIVILKFATVVPYYNVEITPYRDCANYQRKAHSKESKSVCRYDGITDNANITVQNKLL